MEEEKAKVKLANPFANHTSEKKEKEEKKEKKELSKNQKIKVIIFGVLTVLAGALAWYALARILNNGLQLEPGKILKSVITLIFPVLSFCLWVAFVGLGAALIDDRRYLYPSFFVSLLPLFIFLGFSFYNLLVFFILLFAFAYFAFGVRKEEKDRVTFHIVKCLKIHLGLTLILCVAGVSLIFYSRLVEGQKTEQGTMSEAVANTTANLVNVFLESQFENYDSEMTLDEFILIIGQDFIEKLGSQIGEEVGVQESFTQESLVKAVEEAIASGQIRREDLPPDFLSKLDQGTLDTRDIVESQLTDVFTAQFKEARDDFLTQLGIEAEGTDKISEVIKKIISTKLSEVLAGWDHLLPPFLAVSLFFSLIVFLILYKIFVKLFALLIYMILLLANVVVVKKEKGEIERVEFT